MFLYSLTVPFWCVEAYVQLGRSIVCDPVQSVYMLACVGGRTHLYCCLSLSVYTGHCVKAVPSGECSTLDSRRALPFLLTNYISQEWPRLET